MKKRGIVIGGIIVIAGAVGAGGWYYYKNNSTTASADGDVVYVTKISDLNVDNSGTQNRFAGVVEAQETDRKSVV